MVKVTVSVLQLEHPNGPAPALVAPRLSTQASSSVPAPATCDNGIGNDLPSISVYASHPHLMPCVALWPSLSGAALLTQSVC